MHDSTLECRPVTQSVANRRSSSGGIADGRVKRRAFEAEMTLKYCRGAPYWPKPFLVRDADHVLAYEKTHRVHFVLSAQSAFNGRKRWEDQHPQAAAALRRLADAHARRDPTFRTSLTYTRLTAQAALQALREQGL